MKVFLGETSICISEFSKADCLPQCRWASSNPLKAQIEQKEEVGILSLSALTVELGYKFSPMLGIISPGS